MSALLRTSRSLLQRRTASGLVFVRDFRSISVRRNVAQPVAGPAKFKVTVDKDLPEIHSRTPRLVAYYTLFFSVMGAISLVFFNYERQQSPIVHSTLYSARRSQAARDALGNNIRFKDAVPWIYGSLDIIHGDVDLSYYVVGSLNQPAKLHFRSIRRSRGEPFELVAWELIMDDGTVVNLTVDDDRPLISHEAGDSLLGK